VRAGTVARNYAEALRDLALQQDAVAAYGVLLDAVAGALSAEPRVAAVMASPRVPKERKKELLREALAGRAPKPFVRFLEAVVQRGRQDMLGEISRAYEELVDQYLGRVHASTRRTPRPSGRSRRPWRDWSARRSCRTTAPRPAFWEA
jgi:F-type H+-transporting ATPase subunit delta